MTKTLTTERMAEIAKLAIRLQQISSCAAVTSSGETVLHHTHVDEILSALHDVTAEILANREAQPVAEVLSSRSGNDTSTIDKALPAGTKVYTAPPAPAVPEEINPDSPIIIGILPDSDWTRREKCIAADMWNACRAAMLAQPVSQGYKLNSPETPDGWKLVHIDATRAMIDAAQRVEEDGYDAMYKAMLAAAPEGGNG